MKLVVLADNNTYIDQYYLAEPALSIYIENSDKKYLGRLYNQLEQKIK